MPAASLPERGELVDRAGIGREILVAALETGRADRRALHEGARRDSEDAAAPEIAEDVGAGERCDRAAIDIAPGDRRALFRPGAMAIFEHGFDQPGRRDAGIAVRALAEAPAIIAALVLRAEQIDFLPRALPDIADQQVVAPEGGAERVAQAIGVHFGRAARAAGEQDCRREWCRTARRRPAD